MHNPDVFNNNGTRSEYDVNMKKIAALGFRMTAALKMDIMKVTNKPHDTMIYVIDGLLRNPDDLNYFLPAEV